jgi:sterol desaturase/sphingolipid hydroxylase (fatty acid hydroxylase superfamily)
MLEAVIAWLRSLPFGIAAMVLFAENTVVFGLALAFGALVARMFARRRAVGTPGPITHLELAVAAGSVVLNTVVTLAGFLLWRAGIVRFRDDVSLWAAVDVIVLLFAMDLAMYVLHRVAHRPWLFPLLHRLHHRFDRPRPLTLFVLNPAETLSFGGLWLAVIAIYPSSWLGMSIYLALNVAFGVLGHVGVEPFPRAWVKWPALRHVGTSTFHAQHHADPEHNFGFYTLVWDRLFGTLSPEYDARFGGLDSSAS